VAEAFDPPELWQPFGPFSQVAIQGDGRIVRLNGQVALDRDGRIVGPGDMRAPLRQVLRTSAPRSRSRGSMIAPCRWKSRHRRNPARLLRER
jgi:hypothetical protein